MSEQPEQPVPDRLVGVRWDGLDALPVEFVNMFAVQLGPPAGESGVPDGIYMLLGAAPPPLLVGSTEEINAQVAAIDAVSVRPAGRYVMSREHAENLRNFIDSQIRVYDQVTGRHHA